MPGSKKPGIFIMATIRTVKRRLEVFRFAETATDAFIKVEDDFTEENKKQLFAGYNKLQGRLQEYASAVYAESKNRFNPGPGLGNPDLYATGSFYSKMQTIVQGLDINISSTDDKTPRLLLKYPGIFGLGGIYKADFIQEKLRPAYMNEVHKALKL